MYKILCAFERNHTEAAAFSINLASVTFLLVSLPVIKGENYLDLAVHTELFW